MGGVSVSVSAKHLASNFSFIDRTKIFSSDAENIEVERIDDETFVIVYTRNDTLYAKVAKDTMDGKVNLGNSYTISLDADASRFKVLKVDINEFVVVFTNSSSSNTRSIIGNISNLDITFGDFFVLDSENGYIVDNLDILENQKFFVFLSSDGGVIGEKIGNQLVFGDVETVPSHNRFAKLTENKIIRTSRITGSEITFAIFDVIGTALSLDKEVTISNPYSSVATLSNYFNISNNKVVLRYSTSINFILEYNNTDVEIGENFVMSTFRNVEINENKIIAFGNTLAQVYQINGLNMNLLSSRTYALSRDFDALGFRMLLLKGNRGFVVDNEKKREAMAFDIVDDEIITDIEDIVLMESLGNEHKEISSIYITAVNSLASDIDLHLTDGDVNDENLLQKISLEGEKTEVFKLANCPIVLESNKKLVFKTMSLEPISIQIFGLEVIYE